MAGRTGRLIAPARLIEELLHHDMTRQRQQVGPSYNYMDSSLVPEADIRVGVGHIGEVPAGFKPLVKPHKHPVSKVYAIIGDLTVEVTLDGEKHEVSAPAGVFVPAGMMHSIKPLRGSGYLVVVLRGARYE
ncbi:MAG: hypothetical protein V1691_00950 [Chloroflexota bacterium]